MFLFPVHLSPLALIILQEGKDIPGLTDTTVPCRLGPKRARYVHKLYNLTMENDFRQLVVKRLLREKGRRPSWRRQKSSV